MFPHLPSHFPLSFVSMNISPSKLNPTISHVQHARKFSSAQFFRSNANKSRLTAASQITNQFTTIPTIKCSASKFPSPTFPRSFTVNSSHSSAPNSSSRCCCFLCSRSFSTSSKPRPLPPLPVNAYSPQAPSAPRVGRFHQFVLDYGAFGIGVYLSIYASSLAGFWVAFQTGALPAATFFEAEFVLKIIDFWQLQEKYVELTEKYGDLALAWVATKVVEPLRFGLTLVVTPGVKRKFEAMKLLKKNQENKKL